MKKPSKYRISITITEEEDEALNYLAATQGISKAEAIRKAVLTEAKILAARKEGMRILFQNDTETKEILFR